MATYQFTTSASANLEVGQRVVVAVDKATGYACPAGGCGAASWAISGAGCSGGALPAGDNVTLSAGAGSSFGIDTSAITVAGLTCTLTATIEDVYGRGVDRSLSVLVRHSLGRGRARAARLGGARQAVA